MTREGMFGIVERLNALCATPIIKSKLWSKVRSDVEGLRDTFAGYINYLNQVENRSESQSYKEPHIFDNYCC